MDFPYHNPSLQKLSTGVMFLDIKYNPKLHTNQLILIIQVCFQRYLRFVSTIKIFLWLSVFFTNCSNINAITKPIAYM